MAKPRKAKKKLTAWGHVKSGFKGGILGLTASPFVLLLVGASLQANGFTNFLGIDIGQMTKHGLVGGMISGTVMLGLLSTGAINWSSNDDDHDGDETGAMAQMGMH